MNDFTLSIRPLKWEIQITIKLYFSYLLKTHINWVNSGDISGKRGDSSTEMYLGDSD